MNEHEFDLRLRAFYRETADAAVPVLGELWQQVSDIPQDVPVRGPLDQRRTLILLAAAAMLTAALMGGAIAIGSGLIRLPWLPDDRGGIPTTASALSPGMLGPNHFCEPSLPRDVVLWIEVQAGDFGPDEYFLTDAGVLLRRIPSGLEHGAETWSQRRVTTSAAERLVSQVEETGLRDCKIVGVAGTEMGFTARTADGIAAFGLGPDGYRIPTESERAAGARLAEHFDGPDLGLSPDDFLDSAWNPYSLDRWEVMTIRWEGRPATTEGYTMWEGVERPGWADMDFGGVPITAFGEPLALHPSEAAMLEERRCAIVGATDAQVLQATLGDPDPDSQNAWTFHDATGGMGVTIGPVPPHQAGCDYGAEPAEPRENVIEGLDPCAFEPSSWTDVVPQPVIGPGSTDASDPTVDFGGGWATCENFQNGWTYVSRHPISAEAAAAVVEYQFGEGVQAESVRGATVYLNGCIGMDAACGDAVAISVEPYLVIVSPDGPGDADRLRLIAAEVVGRIAAAD